MLQSEKKNLRWEQIALKLDELGYATRQQLQVICELGGDRNASRILSSMERGKYIQSIRRECKIYFITNKGREKVGSKTVPRTGQIEHTLMRNDFYIQLNMPSSWDTEVPIQLNQDEQMKVDAMFMKGNEYHFVEVDYHTAMPRNYEKIEKYARIKKMVFKQFNHTPTVIFYTVSENRKQKLQEYMERVGVKGTVYV